MDDQDRTLLEAFRTNPSEETFRPLYERTKDLVYTICLRGLRSEEDACDALQGVYGRLLAWARAPREEDGNATRENDETPDLLFLIRRLAWLESDRLRKQRTRRLSKEVVVDPFPTPAAKTPTPQEAAENRELRDRLESIVDTLAEPYRVPVVLHYFHGLTHREIADMMGEPVATVSSRIRRALSRMRPLAKRAGLGEIALALGAVAASKALVSPPAACAASAMYQTAQLAAAKIAAGSALAGVSTGTATATTASAVASTGAAASASAVFLGKVLVAVVIVAGVLVAAPRLMNRSTSPEKPTYQDAVLSERGLEPARNGTSINKEDREQDIQNGKSPNNSGDVRNAGDGEDRQTSSGMMAADGLTTSALRGNFCEGRAFDVRTGVGVAGVRFRRASAGRSFPATALRRLLGAGSGEAVSAADGTFSLPVEPGERALYVSLPPGWVLAKPSNSGELRLPEPSGKGLRRVELPLKRGVVLYGRVLALDGATPVPQAPVYICLGERSERLPSVTTDESGGFEFTVAAEGRAWLVSRSDLGTGVKSVDLATKLDRIQVDLVLQAFASISGTVVGPEGKPQAKCVVSVRQLDRKAAPQPETRKPKAAIEETCDCVDELIAGLPEEQGRAAPAMGSGVGRVATDNEGKFTLHRIDPGSISLNCEVPRDSIFLPPEALTLSLAPGDRLENVVLTLHESEFIEGTVAAASGEPLAGAEVAWYTMEDRGRATRSTQTDSSGKYRLAGLRSEQAVQVVTVAHADYKPETRSNVSALDSPVDFVLQPLGGVVIRVIDPKTGLPPAAFRFRLLKRGWSGFDFVPEIQGNYPGPADGRIRYQGATEQDMRIDATEINPDGTPAGRRASAAFHFDPKADPSEVTAPLIPEKTLRGTVVLGDDKQPVEGATVAFDRLRSWTGWQTFPRDTVLDPMPVATDGAGRFTLTGLAPGTFVLDVSKGSLKPVAAPSIEIPEQGDPEPIEVLLTQGATLYGKVTGPDGNPLAGSTVNAMGYQSFGDTSAGLSGEADAEGNYRVEGLEAKRYRVVVHPASGDLPGREEFVVLTLGEQRELNFDFSNTIRLTGQVFVDGKAWDGGLSLRLLSVTGVDAYALILKGNGAYQVDLPPGEYDLAALGRANLRSNSRRFALQTWGAVALSLKLDDSPREQQRDIEIALVSADAYFDLPEGQTVPAGALELSGRVAGRTRDHLDVAPVQGQSVHFLDIPVGEYKVTYRSDDGTRRGESDWTLLAPGKENVLAVFLENTRRERIGGWTPETMSESFVTLAFDAGAAIDSPGVYEAILKYDKGVHGVAISDVELWANGGAIARDGHPGWTGTQDFSNVYRLSIPEIPSGAALVLRATVRCDGGTDSTGSVYLVKVK